MNINLNLRDLGSKPTTTEGVDAIATAMTLIRQSPLSLNVTTDQEAFDKVTRHLKTLKGRAGEQVPDRPFSCLYRAPDGRACAAGVLLPDESIVFNYSGGNQIRNLINNGYIVVGEINRELLNDLQQIHDDSINWTDDVFNEAGLFALGKLAEDCKLDAAVVGESVLEARVAQWTEAVRHAEKLRIERDAAKETFDRLRRATEDADNAAFYAERWAKYALRDMMTAELDKSGIIVRDLV